MTRKELHVTYQSMYDRGMSCSEIADATGKSVSAVAQWLRKQGLAPHGVGNVPHDDRPAMPEGEPVRIHPLFPAYLIGADGVVYSTHTDPPRRITPNESNRWRVKLTRKDGKSVYCVPAVLVAESWIGARPDGYLISYADGDPKNIHADNLAWRPVNAKIDPRDFVAAWQRSGNIVEVCERLASTYPTVKKIAELMTAKGVRLKEMRHEIDADELNQLIDNQE